MAVTLRGRLAPGLDGFLPALIVVCAVLATIAARLPAPPGEALWNLDLPKIDVPFAVFFHEALERGTLPLWNDRLGLGFPLYAEGQIGAFYPPNWLIYRADPVAALDISRTLHLTLAGVGTGLVALRVAGTRTGAVVAAAVAILGGAIVTKLEWTNLVVAYAWLPWILLPLARRPVPTRAGLVTAGLLFGVQALAGHPNTWLLTGLAAAVVLVAQQPRLASVGRVVLFGVVGGAVGAVQLLPTLLLQTLSVRRAGLSPDDVFTSSATVFDPLGFAFAQSFVRVSGNGWDFFTAWYPDGTFALLEASAFVGLAVLALAAVAIGTRRARPWLIVGAVLLAIPVIAAFRPGLWLEIPILNGLRSPVRAYLVVAWVIGILAAIGIARLGRTAPVANAWDDRAVRRAVRAVGGLIALAGVVTVSAAGGWRLFEAMLRSAANSVSADDLQRIRDLAAAALTSPLPVLAEVLAGVAALGLIALAATAAPWRRRAGRLPVRLAVAALAIAPLVLLSPLANPMRPVGQVWPLDSELAVALRAVAPARVLTLQGPGYYDGAPDRLAAAGIADLDMFSSLNLAASDQVTEQTRHGPDADLVRRLVGVDTLVTFGVPCPGTDAIELATDLAVICRVPALTQPYWVPASAVLLGPVAAARVLGGGPAIAPQEATLDLRSAATAAQPGGLETTADGSWRVRVDAPADGYVWLGRAWWPGWTVDVDDRSVTPLRALGGMLIPVPTGASTIGVRLVPWDALLGLVSGLVVAVAVVGWSVSPWARRRWSLRRSSR